MVERSALPEDREARIDVQNSGTARVGIKQGVIQRLVARRAVFAYQDVGHVRSELPEDYHVVVTTDVLLKRHQAGTGFFGRRLIEFKKPEPLGS
jgi:hypothetical protein